MKTIISYDNRFATTLGNETKAENVRELKAFKVHTFHSTSTARHHSDNKVKGQLRGKKLRIILTSEQQKTRKC